MSSVHRIRHALDEASRAATSLQLHLAWKQLECAVNWPEKCGIARISQGHRAALGIQPA